MKAYYGEYTLGHWIKLLINKNIVLPEYQRYYVWQEKDIYRLVESFEKESFISPVLIANIGGKNYIVDGQQRLTSLLLLKYNIFPSKELKKNQKALYCDYNESESGGRTIYGRVMDEAIADISSKFDNENKWKKLEEVNFENLSKDLGMGFIYVNCDEKNVEKQQEFFSDIFRNINIAGVKLTREESRRAYYFISGKTKDFLNFNGFEKLNIKKVGKSEIPDFIRYVSILWEYHTTNDINRLISGCSSRDKLEEYYIDFIHKLNSGDEKEKRFFNFEIIFNANTRDERAEVINNKLSELSECIKILPQFFNDIIECDLYLFGLVNAIIFDDKTINKEFINNITNEIKVYITECDPQLEGDRSPNTIDKIRKRVKKSIEIYTKYVK